MRAPWLLILLAPLAHAQYDDPWFDDFMANRADQRRFEESEAAAERRHQEMLRAMSRDRGESPVGWGTTFTPLSVDPIVRCLQFEDYSVEQSRCLLDTP